MTSYGVIAWQVQGGEPFKAEELEVCKLNSLIIKGATVPRPGVAVQLQFHRTLWEGKILSVHGKKKDADTALMKAETPPSTPIDAETSGSTLSTTKGRSRRKKSFGNDFVHDENDDENQELSSGGKKSVTAAAAAAAANKEKKMEKEKKKQERDRERSVLAEKNALLLSRMVADDAHDDPLDNNLIADCMELLQVPPDNITPIQTPPPTSQLTSQVNITTPQSPPTPAWSPTSVPPIQRLPTITNVIPIQTPLQPLQSPAFTPINQQGRPQYGGKRPRRRQLDVHVQDDDSECSSCKRLKQEVQALRRQLASYEVQNDQAPPRPGKVLASIANQFQMIELSPGSGIYVFDKHIEQAVARKSATACAAFLLNCFYTNTEMTGMNLTGANGKTHPEKEIIDSILAFTMKKHATSAAAIKASLRNKLAANNSRATKV